jgi:subtilase family serine protease
VGGTTLFAASGGRGWSETAWGTTGAGTSGTGSGCSFWITKPVWQTDTGCTKRMTSDVSAVADPNSAVWTYDTYQSSGWGRVGGTSASSPIIASVYAISGNASTMVAGSWAYSHTASLYDVTSGTNDPNDQTCGNTSPYFCVAGPGYDRPTGLGTPNGVGAFVIHPEREPGPETLNSWNYHPGPSRPLCGSVAPMHARCFALLRTD